MVLHRGDDSTTVEGLARSRHMTRQDILNEKRLRSTDMLPAIESDISQSGGLTRQPNPLREENRRLRRELELMQHRLAQHQQAEAQLEQDIENIHRAHQLEIEQYQNSMRELMEELNQKQDALQELDRKYQELSHSFQDELEVETRKMLSEAAQTIKLSPGYTPPILHGVMQTLEQQLQQTDEQRIAELQALMRQMQRKNEQLAQELAREREAISQERQQLLVQRQNIREQSKKRQQYVEASLRARFALMVASITTALLILCVLIQLTLIDSFKIPLTLGLFMPIIIGAVLAVVLSRTGTKPSQPQKKPRPR
jgi:chromosome segregation ATPase